MANERYDLCTAQPGKDGKTYWHKVGVMFPTRSGGGFNIRLSSLPLPNKEGEVWVQAFLQSDEPKTGGKGAGQTDFRPASERIDDKIPF